MSSFNSKRPPIALAVALAGLALTAPALASTNNAKNAEPGVPVVVTGPAHTVGTSSAELTGTVVPHTFATTYWFQYGPKGNLASQTAQVVISTGLAESHKVIQTVANIPSGDYYRLVASNQAGPAKSGREREFVRKVKGHKNAIELPGSIEPIVVGEAFALTGTLTGTANVGREVALEAVPYPYSGPYAIVGSPVTTGIGGRFSFRVPHLSSSTRFRVATVDAPTVYSKVLDEAVEVRVVLKVRTTRHVKGLVRLYGTVSPAETGAHVYIQLEQAAKTKIREITPSKPHNPSKSERAEEKVKPPSFAIKFEGVVRHATRSYSRFSMIVKLQQTGHYRAFVALPPGPLASGHSQTILLQGAAGTKKKSKK
jgi:hypothetical protein